VEQRSARFADPNGDYNNGEMLGDASNGVSDMNNHGYVTSYVIPATADAVTVDAVKLRKQLLSGSNKQR
jgi:hypothetical protein